MEIVSVNPSIALAEAMTSDTAALSDRKGGFRRRYVFTVAPHCRASFAAFTYLSKRKSLLMQLSRMKSSAVSRPMAISTRLQRPRASSKRGFRTSCGRFSTTTF